MKLNIFHEHRQSSCNHTDTAQTPAFSKSWVMRSKHLYWARSIQGVLWGFLALGWGVAAPSAMAAERVTLRLGPFERAIAIADLARFAKSGDLSPARQLYAPVLTSQVRQALNRRLQLDQNLENRLLHTPTGEQVLRSLQEVIPNSTLTQIQAALSLALRQANGLSVVGFLRAYPQENITIDATSAVALAVQINPTYWQGQALGPLLERDLAVASDTPFKPAFDPAAPGSQTVQQQTITLQDQQRHRTIPVDLYWSANSLSDSASRPYQGPLVVMSPGLGADRKFFAYLARHLASHGLTIAALEHPGSNTDWLNSVTKENNPNNLLPAQEFVDRPKDISFLLDELAKLNTSPGPLQGKLNTEQVSVVGHSLGGYTALALAGAELNLEELRQFCQGSIGIGRSPSDLLQCAAASLPGRKLQLRDRRVVQAIALNPVVGHIFGKTGLTQVTTPVLLLAGTEDTVTPMLDNQLRPFTQLPGPKYLLTAIGGTHLSVGDAANPESIAATSDIVKERRGEETKPLRNLVEGVSLAFIEQLTPEAKTYAPFLTPAYAQSLSSTTIPLRLSTELPASVAPWTQIVIEP